MECIDTPGKKQCIHTYLTTCRTNPQPPGFADYLRGTIALFNLSEQYGYTLLLDNSHPIFKYIRTNKNIISNTSNEVLELLPPLSYPEIYSILTKKFQDTSQIIVMTNSFYINDGYDNWGPISETCRKYLRDIFTPSSELQNQIEHIITNIFNFNINEIFKTIHLRTGDAYIHNDVCNDFLYNELYKRIYALVKNNSDTKFVLLCDSSSIAMKLKEGIPELYYWNGKKIHLGDLYNNNENSVMDTLTDFFLLCKSSEILSTGSGFSKVASLLYNIPYRGI
jgi:hypothetical protein